MAIHNCFHTCSEDGGLVNVLKKVPFYSKGKAVNGGRILPFLGKGFYFWEEVKPYVHSKEWGRVHYASKFFVIEFNLNTMGNDGICKMLDLIGKISHREYFREQIKLAKSRLRGNIKVAKVIDLLQKENITNPLLFPFNIIRASDDHYFTPKDGIEFTDDNNKYSNLKVEKWIICVYKEKDVHLTVKEDVYPEREKQK